MGHKLKQEGKEILSTPDFVELKGMDSDILISDILSTSADPILIFKR